MKRREKVSLLLLIILFIFSCYSVSAFATVITPEQVEQILQQQAASKGQSSVSTVSSHKSTGSSSKTYSSALSSEPSSDVSSAISSDENTSSKIVLPSVGSVAEDNPLSKVIVDTNANRQMKWIGIVSWVCIILGILVVMIVVLSNRRPPRGGSGRKRYRRPNRSNKKRLLNDKYYRNIKY